MKKAKLDKVMKALPTGWREEADAMSNEDLKAVIVTASATLTHTKATRDADEKLAGAKEIVKDIGGGYAEVLKAQQAKIDYSLYRLGELGDPSVGDAGDE